MVRICTRCDYSVAGMWPEYDQGVARVWPGCGQGVAMGVSRMLSGFGLDEARM